jgi:sensor histidine kinase YesM
MPSLLSGLIPRAVREWYARKEAAGLAQLTPAMRAEVLAFDAAFKRHLWRNIALFIGVWLIFAVLAKLALGRIGWFGAAMLSGVLLITFILTLSGAWFGPSHFKVGFKSLAVTVAMALAGAAVGGIAAKLLLTDSLASVGQEFIGAAPQILIGGLVFGLAYAVLLTSIAQYRRSQLQRQNIELLQQAGQERLGRQLADARLKLLQAQVEPHFLFNTLASVQQLSEGRAPEAAQLTSQLITFLRAGLASLREDGSTLAREWKSIEAYLKIMQTRLPDRLTFSLHLPEAIVNTPVPPAMLISLVENAIKHGIEPHPEGGHLEVRAIGEGDRLKITVADTGLGPNTLNSGGGVGLDNIRQRLRVLYSDKAKLLVAPNQPRGFIATIDLPLNQPTTTETGIHHVN